MAKGHKVRYSLAQARLGLAPDFRRRNDLVSQFNYRVILKKVRDVTLLFFI